MFGWATLIGWVIGYDLIAKKSLTNLFYEFSRKHPVITAIIWAYLTVHLWMYAHLRRYDPLTRGRALIRGDPV